MRWHNSNLHISLVHQRPGKMNAQCPRSALAPSGSTVHKPIFSPVGSRILCILWIGLCIMWIVWWVVGVLGSGRVIHCCNLPHPQIMTHPAPPHHTHYSWHLHACVCMHPNMCVHRNEAGRRRNEAGNCIAGWVFKWSLCIAKPMTMTPLLQCLTTECVSLQMQLHPFFAAYPR